MPPRGAYALLAGAALFLVAGWAALRHRDALEAAHAEWTRAPPSIVAAVAAGAALAASGAAALAGSLRPISPAANQNPLAAFPFRPDFLATAHRGSRAGSGLACADLPPIGPVPPGLAALEARWRLGRGGGGGGGGGRGSSGARPAESAATTE